MKHYGKTWMIKMPATQERTREILENAMAGIVGARKRFELVVVRVNIATKNGQANLLLPALADLQEAEKKLNKAQKELSKLWNSEFWKKEG